MASSVCAVEWVLQQAEEGVDIHSRRPHGEVRHPHLPHCPRTHIEIYEYTHRSTTGVQGTVTRCDSYSKVA